MLESWDAYAVGAASTPCFDALRREGLYFHWLDIVAPIGIGGVWIAAYIWSLQRQPLLPAHDHRDPRLRPAGEHDHGFLPGYVGQ